MKNQPHWLCGVVGIFLLRLYYLLHGQILLLMSGFAWPIGNLASQFFSARKFNRKIFPWADLDPGRIKQNNSGQEGFFIHVVVSNNGQRAFDIGTTRRDEPSSKSPKCTLSTMHHSPFKLLFYQLFSWYINLNDKKVRAWVNGRWITYSSNVGWCPKITKGISACFYPFRPPYTT